MEYRRDFRDHLQPVRISLIRHPIRSSLAMAFPVAWMTALSALLLAGPAQAASDGFWVLTGGAIAASWVNPLLVRRLSSPTIFLDLKKPDPDPNSPTQDIELVAQRTKAFAESYFGKGSRARSLEAGARVLDEVNAGGYWDGDESVSILRREFVDAAHWLARKRTPEDRVLSVAEKRRLADQKTSAAWVYLAFLHEFIHSIMGLADDMPVAWIEGVTELATRTSASAGLKSTHLEGLDQAIGVKASDRYDRYAAGVSLVVLEFSSLTGLAPQLFIDAMVRHGGYRHGVKAICSAVARSCAVEDQSLEDQMTDALLTSFEKLKPGRFGSMKKNDLEGVSDALREVRFLLWSQGMNLQPPAVVTEDPYHLLLQQMGLDQSARQQNQLAA